MSVIDRIDAFVESLEREAYEVGAGLKSEANFTEIFNTHESLISHETLEDIKSIDIPQNERAEYLSFLLCMIIDAEMKEETDRVITRELELTVQVGEETVPFRRLPVDISNEQTHEGRMKLEALRVSGQEQLNGACEQIMEKTHSVVKELGYENYVDFFEKIEGVSLTNLRTETEKLLAETREYYERELEYYCTEFLKMDRADVAQCDMVYMRRADMFDDLFPPEKLLSSAWKTMENMNINARNHPHITLDIEERPNKSSRAFCSPVVVPEKIYLVIMPHGGVDDYSSFLHELGHTLHYAHTSSSLSVAAKKLGDNSVTEAHAGLIEHLTFNPEWLRRRLGIEEPQAYLRFMKFFELYMLRRYSGKLHYEMELHGGRHSLKDCSEIYAKTLSEATLIGYNPVFYLQDLDNHFYCARYLRSWMLERQIRTSLENNFTNAWFDMSEPGQLLIRLWSQGQKYNADITSSALGFDNLNFDPIIKEYS